MIRYLINGVRGLIRIYRDYGYWGIYLKYSKKVLSGPFKGMKYRNTTSFYSQNYPKIIGCYEEALHPFIYDSINKKYDKIINLGAEQGYYAVGFALFSKNTLVKAWDINRHVLNLLEDNARRNSVSSQIQIFQGTYKKEHLDKECFDKNEKTLILCDIEGGERSLFTKESINQLKRVDILIEIHEFIHSDVKSYLISLFENTHYVNIYQEHIYDTLALRFIKSKSYNRKLFNLIDEKRPVAMEWIFFESKSLGID